MVDYGSEIRPLTTDLDRFCGFAERFLTNEADSAYSWSPAASRASVRSRKISSLHTFLSRIVQR